MSDTPRTDAFAKGLGKELTKDLQKMTMAFARKLERELAEARRAAPSGDQDAPSLLERYRTALYSIARNTCCDTCQEAARVAQAALGSQK